MTHKETMKFVFISFRCDAWSKKKGDDNEEEKVFQLNVNILLMHSLNALNFFFH